MPDPVPAPLPRAPAPLNVVADCAVCPKMCRFACPVAEAEASEAATPAWKGALVSEWATGRAPLAGAVAEAAYKCTDCVLVREACLYEHEPPEDYIVARRAAVAEGVAPDRVRTYVERVRDLGNPFERELNRRLLAAVPPGDLVAFGASADVALFPGCTAARHATDGIGDARRVVESVERRALRVAVSAASCCGYPLYASGDAEGFAQMARKAAASLAGVRDILSLDPGCVWTMNVAWREVGIDIGGRARSLVERLGERIDAVRAAVRTPVKDATFAYHDPCYLGRRRGVYDAPRALLEAATGATPREMPWTRERGWCSGAGSVYGKIWPARVDAIRDRRLEHFAESGASRLATACPSAARKLGAVDVVSVVARAIAGRA